MTLTAGQLRLDLKCGSGHIAQGKKCHKGVGAPNNIVQAAAPPSTASGKTSRSARGRKIAIGAALAGATALGAGLTIASSRKQILNAPEAVRRAAQRGVTEVVHRATSPKPSMKFSTEGSKGMVKDLKKRSLRRKAMLTMEAARRKQEPGYRKPPLKLTAGSVREPRKGGKPRSLLRTAQLTMEAARRKQEPGYRKPARGAKRKDESPRFDVKCGRSGISKGEKCHKSTEQFTGVTSDLHKATNAQLDRHRKRLVADMQKRYGKPITNEEQIDDWVEFARKQPEYAELEEVGRITAKRKLRRKAVARAAVVGGALVAGALLRSKRKDAWVGNGKKLKCSPNSKPCGNACIPKNHRCRASWNKPVKALKAGAVIAGAGLVGTALFHKRANMRAAAAGLGEPVMHGGFTTGNRAQAAKNAANVMSSAQPKAVVARSALTKTAVAQPSRAAAPKASTRPTSPLKAFIDHARKVENAKPVMWDKKNNFLIAENELGSRYGYTLTPDGYFINMKVGKSNQVDFDLNPYSSAIPKEVSAETAKNTVTRMRSMMKAALKDIPDGTELWASTGPMRTTSKAGLSTRNAEKLPPRARLFKMLGFEFDPESGESFTTVGKARKLLGGRAVALTPQKVMLSGRQQ